MNRARVTPVLWPILLAASTSSAFGSYKLDYFDPNGTQSAYTQHLPKLLAKWPPPTVNLPDPGPVIIRAIKTPGHSNYIGFVAHYTVDVPIERAIQTNDDFESYPKIWDTLIEVRVTDRQANRVITSWHRKAPAFFLPNLHYRLLYISERQGPKRMVYRQQLIDGNAMNFCDALIVFDALSPAQTRVTIINFFDANFGPFRGAIESLIWRRSIEGNYKDNMALKARLEHPDWSLKQIVKYAEDALDQNPIPEILYTDAIAFDLKPVAPSPSPAKSSASPTPLPSVSPTPLPSTFPSAGM